MSGDAPVKVMSCPWLEYLLKLILSTIFLVWAKPWSMCRAVPSEDALGEAMPSESAPSASESGPAAPLSGPEVAASTASKVDDTLLSVPAPEKEGEFLAVKLDMREDGEIDVQLARAGVAFRTKPEPLCEGQRSGLLFFSAAVTALAVTAPAVEMRRCHIPPTKTRAPTARFIRPNMP